MHAYLSFVAVPRLRARLLPLLHRAMDLPAADVPRRPAAHRQPPGPEARPQDPQEHARQARNAVSSRNRI